MTDLRQAAQQALEALEELNGLDTETECVTIDVGEVIDAVRAALAQPEQEPCVGKDPRCPCQDGDACHYKDCGNTKARPVPPAQPEQGPVISAWSLREVYFDEDGEPSMHRSPPAAPEHEPVAYYHPHKGFYWAKPTHISAPTIVDVPPVPLYATPPAAPSEWPLIKNILAEYGLDAIAFVAEWKAAQRTWVGLTPEEILDLFDRTNVYGSKWIEFARTIETKLKEKNDY